ncbi:hypothetical protein BST92_03630 [Nonlabens arenilitoris]|uniref:Uncharacterized protein n=1 Tax=Nonlabens arenilitoris TaxID=1217969 RepID=A0A2S7U800_9FLAO|nr:hypothetical protein [Nonlabens arenilitoris]PQJ31069.1 hypothetical protein BST92_03630 [Nonlabens arenilitoris]
MVLNSCSEDRIIDSNSIALEADKSIETNVTFINNNESFIFSGDYNNPYFERSDSSKLFLSESIGLIEISSQSNGNVLISSDDFPFTISLSENSDSSNQITINSTANGVTKEHTMVNLGYINAENLFQDLVSLGSFDNSSQYETQACPPCVVVVAYLVIDSLAEHCDNVIETGVNACRGEDKCASVGLCSVECKRC